jgi:hypothetical protein
MPSAVTVSTESRESNAMNLKGIMVVGSVKIDCEPNLWLAEAAS